MRTGDIDIRQDSTGVSMSFGEFIWSQLVLEKLRYYRGSHLDLMK